jgi:tetratricopeptide (TPR) repeat protein/V8-like Glu-specific endopeptidase
MNRAPWWLTGLWVGTNVVLMQQAVVAKSPQEVARVAKTITVAIKTVGTANVGSGILLQRQGDVYTVLTAGHVVNQPQAVFTIKTVDGQVHQAIAGSVRLPGSKLDLAVLKFRSSNQYTLVKIGTSNTLEELSPIYVAGFPAESTSKGEVVIEDQTFMVTEGKVTGKATKGNEKGYSLVYSNITRPGMSGGPVLNEAGELVAIHGQGDREDDGNGGKTGLNLGIVVERFGAVEVALGLRSEQQIAALPPSTQLNATDYLVSGNDKYNQGDFPVALADYNQSIALDPKNSKAYNSRGILKNVKLNDVQGALSDYNQSIILDPKNSKAYNNRGNLKNVKLNDVQGALSDYNQSIILDPKFSLAYNNRGILKQDKLNDLQGALSDYNQSIILDPKNSNAYNNRGNLKQDKLNDVQRALSDYNQSIILDPKNSNAYTNRAVLKYGKLNDVQGALTDLSKAIEVNSKFSEAYYNRGDLFYSAGDITAAIRDFRKVVAIDPSGFNGLIAQGVIETQQGSYSSAITNFNKAAQLAPNEGDPYKYRGIAYQKQGNRTAAIADWRTAAQAYKNANALKDYKIVQGWLKRLGASE